MQKKSVFCLVFTADYTYKWDVAHFLRYTSYDFRMKTKSNSDFYSFPSISDQQTIFHG